MMPNPVETEGWLVLREGGWATLRAQAHEVRRQVFQEEQSIPQRYDEDGLDEECTHIVVESRDGTPLGTSRLHGDRLGRLAVIKAAREQGVGFLLVASMLRIAHRRKLELVWANAQPTASGLARIFGFDIEPEPILLAGIVHHRVVKHLGNAGHPAASIRGD